jgi:hypothetical protein
MITPDLYEWADDTKISQFLSNLQALRLVAGDLGIDTIDTSDRHWRDGWTRPPSTTVAAGRGQWPGRLLYRRRSAASSAVVLTFHMLSATLIVTPGETI